MELTGRVLEVTGNEKPRDARELGTERSEAGKQGCRLVQGEVRRCLTYKENYYWVSCFAEPKHTRLRGWYLRITSVVIHLLLFQELQL